jgi:hypothetical protein
VAVVRIRAVLAWMVGLALLAGLVAVSMPHSRGGVTTAVSPAFVHPAPMARRPAAPARASAPPGYAITPDGRVSFAIPPGWRAGPCPSGAADCVQVVPAYGGDADSVAVVITGQAPGVAPNGAGFPQVRVGGVPAFRIDLPSNQSVTVSGALPGSSYAFTVNCRYQEMEQVVREGCASILGTLTIQGNPA